MDFRAFLLAYEDLVRKVHGGAYGADDFVGATVSITNPGTLGTVQSVPRLMPGQGAIFGVGALGWPAGLRSGRPARARRTRCGQGHDAHLHLRPPHHPGRRVRPVPEVRRRVSHRPHDFYDEVFASLGIPYEPARWAKDRNPSPTEGDAERILKQIRVQALINMYRVRGHLNAHLDPLSSEPPRRTPSSTSRRTD